MRFIFLLALMGIVSCGNKNDSKSSSTSPRLEDRQISSSDPDVPASINNPVQECVGEVCYETITDPTPVEITEVVTEAPVEISEDSIVVTDNSQTETVESPSSPSPSSPTPETPADECEVNLLVGDEYEYEIKKDKLFLEMNNRKFIFRKLSEDGDDLYGSWVWKGPEGEKWIVLTLTIMDQGKIVLRKTCEAK